MTEASASNALPVTEAFSRLTATSAASKGQQSLQASHGMDDSAGCLDLDTNAHSHAGSDYGDAPLGA